MKLEPMIYALNVDGEVIKMNDNERIIWCPKCVENVPLIKKWNMWFCPKCNYSVDLTLSDNDLDYVRLKEYKNDC